MVGTERQSSYLPPQERSKLGEAAGARCSSCPGLMRLQGGAKHLLAAVACPTPPLPVVLCGAKAVDEYGSGP